MRLIGVFTLTIIYNSFRVTTSSASFNVINEALPKFNYSYSFDNGEDVIHDSFPRKNRLSYIGLSMWNSRGISLERAIQAMLGDDNAFYESPLFTKLKHLCMGSINQIKEVIYSTSGHWTKDGLDKFFRQFETELKTSKFISLQKECVNYCFCISDTVESQQACVQRKNFLTCALTFAKHKIDNLVSLHLKKHTQSPDALLTYLKNWSDDVELNSTIYSTIVDSLAIYRYGPNTLTLSSEALDRAVDLNILKAYSSILKRKQGDFQNISEEVIEFLSKTHNCSYSDHGEFITPGYILPEHIISYQIRRKTAQPTAGDYGNLEYSFVKFSNEAFNNSFILVFSGLGDESTRIYKLTEQNESQFYGLFPAEQGVRGCSSTYKTFSPPKTIVDHRSLPIVALIFPNYKDVRIEKRDYYLQLLRNLTRNQPKLISEFHDFDKLKSYGMISSDDGSFYTEILTLKDLSNPEGLFISYATAAERAYVSSIKPQKWALTGAAWALLMGLQLVTVLGDYCTRRGLSHDQTEVLNGASVVTTANALVSLITTVFPFAVFQFIAPVFTALMPTTCYYEADILGQVAYCMWPSHKCTEIKCPSQGPLFMGWQIFLHPIIIPYMIGLSALYFLCDSVLAGKENYVYLKAVSAVVISIVLNALSRGKGSSGQTHVVPYLSAGLCLMGCVLLLWKKNITAFLSKSAPMHSPASQKETILYLILLIMVTYVWVALQNYSAIYWRMNMFAFLSIENTMALPSVFSFYLCYKKLVRRIFVYIKETWPKFWKPFNNEVMYNKLAGSELNKLQGKKISETCPLNEDGISAGGIDIAHRQKIVSEDGYSYEATDIMKGIGSGAFEVLVSSIKLSFFNGYASLWLLLGKLLANLRALAFFYMIVNFEMGKVLLLATALRLLVSKLIFMVSSLKASFKHDYLQKKISLAVEVTSFILLTISILMIYVTS